MRITKERLHNRFATLARLLEWQYVGSPYHPVDYDEAGNRCGCKAKVGHVFLEHNSVYGWSINRMVNEAGGESRLKESCSAAEMDAWLGGAIFAADHIKRGE